MNKQTKDIDSWFLFWMGAMVIAGIISVIYVQNTTDKRMNTTKQEDFKKNHDSSNSNPCYGNENCIAKVRNNFKNTGKQILGEQYLGDGKFGISFLDASRGEAYNAYVSTDCNCNVTNVNVSIMR